MADETKDEILDEAADLGNDVAGQESLAEFLAQFSGSGHQYIIYRSDPKLATINGRSHKVSGHLETVYVAPTLEYLREHWGGGTFDIRVLGPAKNRRGVGYLGSRRIEIAGSPRLKPESTGDEPAPSASVPGAQREQPEVLNRLIDGAMEDKRRAEERADRERQRAEDRSNRDRQQASDPTLWQTTIGTIERTRQAQIETLQQQVERRDREVSELRQMLESSRSERPPLGDPEVLKLVFGRNSDDATRLAEQHRQELAAERERATRLAEGDRERAIRELEAARERAAREIDAERRDRERMAQEIQAERDRAARDVAAERERAMRDVEGERREHEKAVAIVERLHRSEIENLRTSNQQLLATKDEHIHRLEEELRTIRQSNRPHDTLSDLERMGKVVSAMRTIVPGMTGERESEPATPWEKFFDRAQPLFERVVDNATRPAPAIVPSGFAPTIVPRTAPMFPGRPALGAPPLPPGAFPRPMPMRQPVPIARMAPQPIPPMQRVPVEQPAFSNPAPAAPTAQAGFSPEILQGIEFLETALRNGKSGGDVARTAHRLFPKGDLSQLVSVGHQAVVGEIEKVAPDSMLAGPGGRTYLRDFLDALKAELENG